MKKVLLIIAIVLACIIAAGYDVIWYMLFGF